VPPACRRTTMNP